MVDHGADLPCTLVPVASFSCAIYTPTLYIQLLSIVALALFRLITKFVDLVAFCEFI